MDYLQHMYVNQLQVGFTFCWAFTSWVYVLLGLYKLGLRFAGPLPSHRKYLQVPLNLATTSMKKWIWSLQNCLSRYSLINSTHRHVLAYIHVQS